MKVEQSTAALLPGDTCVREATGEGEYRVRHVDAGEAWLTPLTAGKDVIVPTSECRIIETELQARMEEASSHGDQSEGAASSTPTFPDGTTWP